MIALNFQLTNEELLIHITIDDITLTLTIRFQDLEHYVLSFDDIIQLAMQIYNVQNVIPIPDDFFNENPLGGVNNPIVIYDSDEDDEGIEWDLQ